MRIIRKKEAVKREISKTYKVKNFLTKHDCEQLSVAVGVAENHSEITKNTKSNRAYFVLKGELIVNVAKKPNRERLYSFLQGKNINLKEPLKQFL